MGISTEKRQSRKMTPHLTAKQIEEMTAIKTIDDLLNEIKHSLVSNRCTTEMGCVGDWDGTYDNDENGDGTLCLFSPLITLLDEAKTLHDQEINELKANFHEQTRNIWIVENSKETLALVTDSMNNPEKYPDVMLIVPKNQLHYFKNDKLKKTEANPERSEVPAGLRRRPGVDVR